MLDYIAKIATVFFANWQRALLGGLIVISTVITLVGALKMIAIDKIPNKLVRKIVLAFSSVVLAFPITALYFLGDGINFEYYWVGSGLCSVATILVYWLYENTGCRNLIHYVGSLTVGKFVKYIARGIVASDGNTKTSNEVILKEMTSELKNEVKAHVVRSYFPDHDKDLDNI